MKKLLFSAAAICALGAFTAPQAQAQSLNYGVMQEMFGEPVTTSANGSPMRASDAPLDMTIISADDIARYPAREIPDILRYYAGVSIRQDTSTHYSVGIRGYNSPSNERLLVLVNGRQVFEDYYGLVNWAAVPVELNEIRQIEIVRGPNTALFGFNAVSGVINIVTINPLYDDVDVLETDMGINDYRRGSAVYTWQNDDKFGLRVSAGGYSIEEDDNDINPTLNYVRTDLYARNFNADVALQLNDKTQMRFEISRGITDDNTFNAFGAVSPRDSVNRGMRVNLNSDTDWGIIDATVYRNSVDAEYKANAGFFLFENNVTVLQLSDTFKVGTNHTLRFAGEYRTNSVDNFINSLNFGEVTQNITSASALWYWNVNEKLSTSAAFRFDHVNSDFDPSALGLFTSPFSPEQYQNRYDEFGYNLGVVYKATDFDTIRLTAAKGVDLVSTFEQTLLAPGATSFYGNPTTEASDIHDFQLGYERQISSINGKFKTGAFYQRVNEHQGFLARSATLSTVNNIGDSEVWGGEVGLSGMTDAGIRWGLNYSYSKVDNDFANGTNFEDQNSDHIVSANIGYMPNEQWVLDGYLSWFSEFDQGVDTSSTTRITKEIDPEFIFDARIAYKPEMIEGLTLSLNGQAIFGDHEQSAYDETKSQVFLRAKYEF